jgi:phosphonate transport system substrate-binding protein
MKKLLIAALVVAPVLFGCSRSEPASPKDPPQRETILIGLIPEHNIFKQVERYEPFVEYLSGKIDRDIKLKILTRYGNIIDNFVSEKLDGAFFGSFTYTLAHAKLGVEVLARPEYFDGTSTYHGLMFVRRDSSIRTARDMKGKRFAFVDKATTAGYLLPLAYFRKNGVSDYSSYLREFYFTGTHEDAIYDVINKKTDIGAAKNTVFYRLANGDNRIFKDLIILDKSPDVPENGLAVRKDLDETVKSRLKEALLTMHEDPEGKAILNKFGAQRFIETTDDDYEPVYKYANQVKLDLSTYDYMNE